MRSERIITTVDSHTEGEPTRLITGGLPHIPGKKMSEKIKFFEKELDSLRTSLLHEPRGHLNMVGAVLVEPTREDADFGIFFLNAAECRNMCGHGTIGAATTLVELGMVKISEPYTVIVFDTPAGLVTAKVAVKEGSPISVSMMNIPSFLFARDVSIEIPGQGQILVDVAFGGNFYVLVDADELRLSIISENVSKFRTLVGTIIQAVNSVIQVEHPEKEYIKGVKSVHFYGSSQRTGVHSKHLTFGSGKLSYANFDRSPCGTGTSARIATLYTKGEIGINQPLEFESVIGTAFKAKAIREVTLGKFQAIIPEITGTAYITGINQFMFAPNDPLKHGFLV